MKRTAVFFLIVTVLLPMSSCNTSGLKKENTYILLRKFSGNNAGLMIKPQEVRTYNKIDWDINNLDPMQRKSADKSLKGWKGEAYKVFLYKWVDNKFIFVMDYYTDDCTEAIVKMKEYDLNDDRNILVPHDLIHQEITYLRSSNVLLKAYAQGDLDGDGDEDLVIVYRDTTEKNITKTGYSYPECHMIFYETLPNNIYKEVFQFDQLCDMVCIGKIEIRDLTEDKIPEVILWVLSQGASGYSVVAKIFSRVHGEIKN